MPPFITSLFSSGAAKLVDSFGSAIDKLVTSDEERAALKIKLKKVVNDHSKEQLDALASYDKEVTSRHVNDMKSDSWLSKNIRPITLAFLIGATVLLAYLSIFLLPPEKADQVLPWLELLKVLDVTIITFYFGSRGMEKIQHARRS